MAPYPQQAPPIVGAGGTGNAITISIPNVSSLANIKGVVIGIGASANNTGATTINVNGLGAQPVVKPTQAGYSALTGTEFIFGVITQVYWAGTEFILVGPIPAPGFTPIVITPGSTSFGVGSHTFTIPAHVTSIYAIVTGAGGGRGIPFGKNDVDPDSFFFADGGGGGGGGTTMGWLSCTPGDVISFAVGAAGTNGGDVFTGDNPATDGGSSWFGVLSAAGGTAGSGNSGGAGGGASGGSQSMNGGYGGTGMIGFFVGATTYPFRCVAGGASYWGGANAPGAGACGGPWGVTSPNGQLNAGDGIVSLFWIGGGP